MKTFELDVTEEQVNDLLECDALNIGGTLFIKKKVVVEGMVMYAKKKIDEEKNISINRNDCFTEADMEKAWEDGCTCGEYRGGMFDIENYRKSEQ